MILPRSASRPEGLPVDLPDLPRASIVGPDLYVQADGSVVDRAGRPSGPAPVADFTEAALFVRPRPDTGSTRPVRSRGFDWRGKCLALAIAAFAAGVWAGSARGHSWYSGICCSDQDCAPVARDRVVWTPQGWRVTLGPGDHLMSDVPFSEVVPFDAVLPSEDGDFHACVRPSVSPAMATGARLICLYVPDVGAGS